VVIHPTFAARQLTPTIAADADLAAFRPRLPAHVQPDIPDPIGHDEAFFAMVGAQIAKLMLPSPAHLIRLDAHAVLRP
jgi:hypothetical protein